MKGGAYCQCYEGWGHPDDVHAVGLPPDRFCTERVCPRAKSTADLPTSATVAHHNAECSNNGLCDRLTGNCLCFASWSGDA